MRELNFTMRYIILTILCILTFSSLAVAQKKKLFSNKSSKTVSCITKIYGVHSLRLSMTREEVSSLFYKFRDKKIDEDRFEKIWMKDTQLPSSMPNISRLELEFLDNKLFAIKVVYKTNFSSESIDDWSRKVETGLKLSKNTLKSVGNNIQFAVCGNIYVGTSFLKILSNEPAIVTLDVLDKALFSERNERKKQREQKMMQSISLKDTLKPCSTNAKELSSIRGLKLGGDFKIEKSSYNSSVSVLTYDEQTSKLVSTEIKNAEDLGWRYEIYDLSKVSDRESIKSLVDIEGLKEISIKTLDDKIVYFELEYDDITHEIENFTEAITRVIKTLNLNVKWIQKSKTEDFTKKEFFNCNGFSFSFEASESYEDANLRDISLSLRNLGYNNILLARDNERREKKEPKFKP